MAPALSETERNPVKIGILALCVLAVSIPAAAAMKTGAANAPASSNAGAISGQIPPAVKLKPVVTLPKRFGTPGEKIALEANVKEGTAAVPGYKLAFVVDGKPAGDATTDAAGKAVLDYKIPGDFVQKHYIVKANGSPASGTGDLSVLMSTTKITIGDLIWGTYKGEPGSPTGSYTFTLLRTSDGNAIVNPPVEVQVVVNGAPYGYHIMSDAALMPLPDLPAGKKQWAVKISFAGNNSYLASTATKTFTKP